MSDTALNIVAIAIFTITMTVLTTPFTGVSPLIPTGITVLFLAVYGLDSGYNGGAIGAKVIYWIESKLPKFQANKARILHHEAGHFLAAHILGIKVVGYNLQTKAGVEVDNSEVSLNTLERYSTIWMAGIAAEEYLYSHSEGGDDDLNKLRAAINHTANPEIEERWAKIRARNLIRSNSEAFTALVAKMQVGAPLEECYEAIDTLVIKAKF
jgi:hypothetical protein